MPRKPRPTARGKTESAAQARALFSYTYFSSAGSVFLALDLRSLQDRQNLCMKLQLRGGGRVGCLLTTGVV